MITDILRKWINYYLFVCFLFNDAVTSSDYIVSNSRMISEYWIEEYVEGSGRGLNQYTIPTFAWRDWVKDIYIFYELKNPGEMTQIPVRTSLCIFYVPSRKRNFLLKNVN
jgi:hypothetical protein